MVRYGLSESFLERCQCSGQFGFGVFVHGFVVVQFGQQSCVLGFELSMHFGFKVQNLLDFDVVQVAFVHSEQSHTHDADRLWVVLSLLE